MKNICPKCGSEIKRIPIPFSLYFTTITLFCTNRECDYQLTGEAKQIAHKQRLDKVLSKFEWENNVCAKYRKNNYSLLEIEYVYPNFYISREVIKLKTIESLLEDIDN